MGLMTGCSFAVGLLGADVEIKFSVRDVSECSAIAARGDIF